MSIIAHIFRILAPHECLMCGNEDYVLCPSCIRTLPSVAPTAPPGIAAITAVTAYDGPARQLVHALKFARASAAAPDIARAVASRLSATDATVVTYVPTVSARVRQRGYDQARLIAQAVAKECGLPCLPLLARVGNQRQVGANKTVRTQQMKSAFRPVNQSAAIQQRILLIDDVITTGSTLSAAAAVLQRMGVSRVDAAVFAAADSFQITP